MTLKEFAKKLKSIKPELQNKEIFVKAENGLFLEPQIKFVIIDEMKPLDKSKNNVKNIIIS